MTDPETANRTYVGPMTPELVEQILIKEKPDALLPTMGGQTALNLTKTLAENGILEKHGVELIGAKLDAINKAEDRQLFKEAMEKIGLKTPPSGTANNWDEAVEIADYIGSFPLIFYLLTNRNITPYYTVPQETAPLLIFPLFLPE